MISQPALVTADNFDEFITRPENSDRLFELIHGEIVEVVSNGESSAIGAIILSFLALFIRQHKLGRVTGADGGYMVSGERYIPDAAYISKVRQPQPSRTAYNPLAPDLAVEVLSPTNDPSDMRIKIVNFLRAGTIVWLVDPAKQQIEVYQPEQAPVVLTITDILDGGTLLPGFTLALSEIFAD